MKNILILKWDDFLLWVSSFFLKNLWKESFYVLQKIEIYEKRKKIL